MNKYRLDLPLIAVAVDYFQVVAMFAQTNIQWPAAVKTLFSIMSAFNLNLDLIAPECAIPNVSFAEKWAFIELLPMFGTF